MKYVRIYQKQFCEPYYLPTCDLDIAMTTACMSVCKHKPRDDILSDVGGLYFVVTPIVQLTVIGFTKGTTSCLDSIVCTQKLFSTILHGNFSPTIYNMTYLEV